MAQKGRGIFMVYVDIDAQHAQEFDKWYNEEHLPGANQTRQNDGGYASQRRRKHGTKRSRDFHGVR